MKPNIKDFDIVEGTTHTIKIKCLDENKQDFDLNCYRAMFVIVDSGIEDKKQIIIENNTINVKIEPKDTLNREKLNYECRIFNNSNDVFHVVFGKINVIKAVKPIIEYS
jgi:hypothetical protein